MRLSILASFVTLTAFMACDDGSSGDSSSTERAGPAALAGHGWTFTVEIEGIQFDNSMDFDEDSVGLTTVCSLGADALTATVEAPVHYHYSATINEAVSAPIAARTNWMRKRGATISAMVKIA